jgi:hypothetical protein
VLTTVISFACLETAISSSSRKDPAHETFVAATATRSWPSPPLGRTGAALGSAIQTVPRRRSQASDFDPRQRSINPSQPLGPVGFGSEFHRGQCLAPRLSAFQPNALVRCRFVATCEHKQKAA